VVPESVRVLEAAARKFGIGLRFDHFDFASCDYYAAHGTMMVTGLVGFQVAWARARAGARQAAASSVARAVLGIILSDRSSLDGES